MHEFSTHGHYQNIKLGYFDRDGRIIELIKLTAELNEVLVGSGYTVGIYECATYKLLLIFQAISLKPRDNILWFLCDVIIFQNNNCQSFCSNGNCSVFIHDLERVNEFVPLDLRVKFSSKEVEVAWCFICHGDWFEAWQKCRVNLTRPTGSRFSHTNAP